MKKYLPLFIAFIISTAGIFLIPNLEKMLIPTADQPGMLTFLGVGSILIAFTAFVLYSGIQLKTSLPRKFLLLAFLYNALIVLVKFILAPWVFYTANKYNAYSTLFGIVNGSGNADFLTLFLATSLIFVCYFLFFFGLYIFFKKKVKSLIGETGTKITSYKRYKVQFSLHKLALLLGFLLIIATMIITGTYLFVFAFVFVPALSYIQYLFSIPESIFIALALTGAIMFATAAFASIAEQAVIVRKTALIATFFWIGLSFLLLYHGLWIVYFFIITAIWPLKVITPK